MLDEMLNEMLVDFLRFYTSIQHQLAKIHGAVAVFIHNFFLFTNSIYISKLKMEAEQSLILVVLSELMDSDDKKPTRRKTRSWIKRGTVTVYFNGIIRELTIKDRMGFKEIFWMSVENFELVLKYIDNIRSFGNMCKSLTDVTGDAILDENSF